MSGRRADARRTGSPAGVTHRATGPENRLDSSVLPPGLTDGDAIGRCLVAKATGRGRLATTTLAHYRTETNICSSTRGG